MQHTTLLNKRELKYLLAGILVLMAANLVDHLFGRPFWGITRFIYLGFDDNVPAWYSSILLAVAGLISYECSVLAKRLEIQGSLAFLLFAGLLFVMSADELAQLHEIVFGEYAAKYLGISAKAFAKQSPWVWVGGPLVAAIFACFGFFLKGALSAVRHSMLLLVIGFSLIILGGVVLESTINFIDHAERPGIYNLEIIVEESLEMIGTIAVAYALILWRDGVMKLHR